MASATPEDRQNLNCKGTSIYVSLSGQRKFSNGATVFRHWGFISLAKLRVRNQTRDTALADRADIADTASARNRGLLSRVGLAPGEGLWIVPCEGVHTIGMKFPIDVVFLNKKRKVLKIRREMKKWRMAMCLRGHSVLELPAGTCDGAKTAVGDQLELEKYEE